MEAEEGQEGNGFGVGAPAGDACSIRIHILLATNSLLGERRVWLRTGIAHTSGFHKGAPKQELQL